MKTELEGRTKRFSVALVKATGSFRDTLEGEIMGRQLLRAGTSVGANYHEANRAESRDDFIHKVALAEKEASETAYWLEVCLESGVGPPKELNQLLQEACELLAILVTIGKNAKKNRQPNADGES